jgi:hypothetical protein
LVNRLRDVLAKEEDREDRMPWYRRRDYKGNLTEKRKERIDHFRWLAQQPGGKHPADSDKESVMRRRSERHTLDQRLKEEKARIEARLEAIEPGPQRDLLELKVRQIETAFHMDRFLSSTGAAPAGGLSQHERHAG